MCDLKDPCCILSPAVNQTVCAASGKGSLTDPCSVMNPIADKGLCMSKQAAKTTNTATGGSAMGVGMIVLIIVAVIVGLLLIVGLFSAFTAASAPVGGSRKFKSFFKRFF